MEVRTLVKKGMDHLVYCEDDLFFCNYEETYIAAVFDGCSTGIKSHFASSLFSKILKKCCNHRELDINIIPIEHLSKMIFTEFARTLKNITGILKLQDLEIVSTMIFTIIRNGKAFVLVSGDGYILNDDEHIEIQSPSNAPNYLAYHLEEEFEELYNKAIKEYSFDFKRGFSICTDGITSFRSGIKEDVSNEVINTLLIDMTLIKSEAMLARKYNLLLKKGYSNFDDVSIIRFINENI